MAIIGEDGTGVAGAEAYGADPVALISAYWALRTHRTEATTWTAATTAKMEGAAREAAAYMDATWGAFYLGQRYDYDQGRDWPRIRGYLVDDVLYPTYALAIVASGGSADTLVEGDLDITEAPLTDNSGRELPALPVQLLDAQAELAVRALAVVLAADADRLGMVTSERKKVGSLESETKYATATAQRAYGMVLGILAPLLNGSQPGSTTPSWFWR